MKRLAIVYFPHLLMLQLMNNCDLYDLDFSVEDREKQWDEIKMTDPEKFLILLS